MAGWVADKSWLLIMVLQIDSENSATGLRSLFICNHKKNHSNHKNLQCFERLHQDV